MDTKTITVEIADAPLRSRAATTARAVSAIARVLDASPHLILDVEPDSFRGVVLYVLASDDIANATTMLREAIVDIEGAEAPLTEIVYQ